MLNTNPSQPIIQKYLNQGFVEHNKEYREGTKTIIKQPSLEECYEKHESGTINLKEVKVEYITLATGLNFKVINQGNLGEVIRLNISRFSKVLNEFVYTDIYVDINGYFLPNQELSQQDIVKATYTKSGLKISKRTESGQKHFENSVVNDLGSEIKNEKAKVLTRNGLWYTVQGVTITPNKTFKLKLLLARSELIPIYREYDKNGFEQPENTRDFSPHDIVRVVNF